MGECSGGHQYLKVIFCGKDWCPGCREITHKRRQGRLLPKVVTMERAGYFVFTIPEELREFYQDPKNLSSLRTYLRRKLKRVYPGLKAITRWHWFGDKDLTKYHPHLNVLVDSLQKLPKKTIEELRRDYKEALENHSEIRLNKEVNIHYHYLKTKGKIFHALRYITRPTFKVYQKDLAMKLKGYKNTSTWGRFRSLSSEELERLAIQKESNGGMSKEGVLLTNNICPHCGERLRWRKEVYPGTLSSMGREVGEGYFELPFKLPRGSPLFEFPKDQLETELLIGPVQDYLGIRRRFVDFQEGLDDIR